MWCGTMLVCAQGSKALSNAEKFFGVKSYDQALPLYEEAIKAGEKDPMVHYKAGVCYQKQQEIAEQVKAIPYFEYAIQNAKGLPPQVTYDLGELYLKDENLAKATATFSAYRDLVKADKKATAMADEAIKTAHNAVAFMSVPPMSPSVSTWV